MIEAFESGGFIMWPILVCALLVLGVTANSGRKLVTAEGEARRHSALAAIPFWGAFAVVLGVLGTVVGWMQMAQALERAGAVDVTLVGGGFGVSLISTIFGLLVLSVSLLCWFALWLPRRRLAVAGDAPPQRDGLAQRDDLALMERLEHLEERLRFTEAMLESRGGRPSGGGSAD